MKSFFVKYACLIIFIFCVSPAVYANELQYVITPEKIDRAWINESAWEGQKKFEVGIRLKEPYRSEFAQLTGGNIGRRLKTIFSGRALVDAVIKARIESGDIVIGVVGSGEDAGMLVYEVLSGGKRCGAVP